MTDPAPPTRYPPEPWQLQGQLYASAFFVSDLRADVPPGWRVVRVGGRAVVGAVWVDYEPGGVLSYRELMTTVLVRRGWRVLPTITHIWVDSVESRDGGRALWGIPKGLASFAFTTDFRGTKLSAELDDGRIADGSVRARRRLPIRLPLRFTVAQTLHGRAKLSPVRSVASIAVARARFTAAPQGPLAFLAGRRPLVSFVLHDFRMTFGGS